MAFPRPVRTGFVAVLLLIAFVPQGTTRALAGTTGAISGTVIDPQSDQPVAGARVTAVSPSQTATTTTDAAGHFSFASLAADTYDVTVQATSTRDAASVSVKVQADQTLTVSIAQTTSHAVDAVTRDKAAGLGGGGNLNTAWSAISMVPGVFVQPNQAGYIGARPTISIRGGDYDQIGYELDGIPVNRAFDNAPSGALSSLGQQELQVYTGAPAANAEANGISGYINQIIRTGTAPASRNLELAIGTPTFYNKISFEAGGANPARTFSYYLGAGAYNQNFRYYDQYNGASLQPVWGAPLADCPSAAPTGCHGPQGQDYTNGGQSNRFAWALGPYSAFSAFVPAIQNRDTVANFHFGIPRTDGNRDDVQLLFDNTFINNFGPTSTNDQGGLNFLGQIDAVPSCPGFTPCYRDGFHFVGAPNGTVLPPAFAGGNGSVADWLFPDSPGGRPFRSEIDPNRRDAFVNNQSIVKLQYQHNFGTNAFLRVYGYTYYSDWLQNGPQSTLQNNLGFVPSQYLLDSHTRGVSAQFTDQINAQHLISVQGAYTTASTSSYYNTGIGFNGQVGWLVDSTNPYSGVCYNGVASGPCAFGTFTPQGFSIGQALSGTVIPASAFGNACGGHACAYVVGANGDSGFINSVTPKFTSASITDLWQPTSRLNVNLGLRYDSFVFQGADTTDSPARALFYNAYNLANPGAPLVNVPNQVESYSVLQPRIGLTYTINPSTVLRASYGRYAQAPNSAFEQFNFLQPNDPAELASFARFGLPTTPGHPVRPEVSNNYDFSYEHQFRGDTAVKFTPFLRKTQDQIQQFFLDQRTSFVSGLNVGTQTSQGFELEVDKGDFSRNGLAARLAFTYTNSYINYARPENGNSVVIDPINFQIRDYNAYTSFCATNPGDARCGSTQRGGPAGACYTPSGVAAPGCGAGTIANPYWNAPVQPLLDANARYPVFDTFPGSFPGGGGYTTYGAPYVATLIVQYKHGPLAVTPALQFFGGARYGVPLATSGIAPDRCTGGLGGSTAGDPRYPYGAAGGAPYDATTCGLNLSIPNLFTDRFDGVGAFVAPNSLLLHTQVTYDVNKRVTLVGNFANIINRCWGGTKVPFAVGGACGYRAPPQAGGGNPNIGNAFNPGWNLQPQVVMPYFPTFPGYPFNMYFEARIKI